MPTMTLMQGKRGLVVGIANERSYAWYIAKSLVENGAECVFTHLPGEKMERRCRKALEAIGIDEPDLHSMDASSDEDLDRVFGDLVEQIAPDLQMQGIAISVSHAMSVENDG